MIYNTDVIGEAAEKYRKATPLNRKQYQALKLLMTNIIKMSQIADPEVIKPLIPVIESIEYQMQDVLGLRKDSKYHRYWMELGGCTCPYIDNMDIFGTGEWYHSEDCPYHGTQKSDK